MTTVSLTPDQRHRLTAVLQDMDPTAPRECRRYARRSVALSIWAKTLSRRGKSALFRVSAVNVSTRGVGLLSRRQLSVGERFVLPLRFEEGGGRLALCQVRNSRKLDDRQHHIGAMFVAWVNDDRADMPIPADWTA